MPRFQYKATTPEGELLEGQMEADDRESVIRQIHAQGHIPIRAEEVRASGAHSPGHAHRGRGGRVGRRQLGVLTLELATLLEAGVPLERSLGVLSELADSEALYALLNRLRLAVRQGRDFSDTLADEPRVFFPLYVNLVRAGEAGGALGPALARLSEFMERSRELRESVISALTYPCILVVLALASLAIIVTVVVPRFAAMFADAGQSLPLATQMLVDSALFVKQYWWGLLAGVIAIGLYLRVLWADPGTRLRLDRWFLKIPVWGDFLRKLEAARFSRALGTLLGNGVPMLTALAIARQIIGNRAVAEALAGISASVREGKGVAAPVMACGMLPPLASHMLQVGEETGQLEGMLGKLAEIYDREVRLALARMVTVLEPLIILGLGLVIAGIIMSVLVAVLRVNELAF